VGLPSPFPGWQGLLETILTKTEYQTGSREGKRCSRSIARTFAAGSAALAFGPGLAGGTGARRSCASCRTAILTILDPILDDGLRHAPTTGYMILRRVVSRNRREGAPSSRRWSTSTRLSAEQGRVWTFTLRERSWSGMTASRWTAEDCVVFAQNAGRPRDFDGSEN